MGLFVHIWYMSSDFGMNSLIARFLRRDSHAGIVRGDTYNSEGSPLSFFLPTVDMARILRDLGSPLEIDYISLDVEGAGNETQTTRVKNSLMVCRVYCAGAADSSLCCANPEP